MIVFHFHTEPCDLDELVAAVSDAAGARDVRLLGGWDGCDRETGAMIANEERGAVNVEWLRRKGRFALEVQVFGADVAPGQTSARFARAVAKSLRRPVLFSDCSANPFAYFSAEPDGTIWAQMRVDDDDDVMDLVAGDPRYPKLAFGPDALLPERPLGSPVSWQPGDAGCETGGDAALCRVFYTACPKRRG